MAESYPPLAGIPQSVKIRWYRSPVDREVLKGLVERSDLKGALQAGGHLFLAAATGTLVYLLYSRQIWVGFAAVRSPCTDMCASRQRIPSSLSPIEWPTATNRSPAHTTPPRPLSSPWGLTSCQCSPSRLCTMEAVQPPTATNRSPLQATPSREGRGTSAPASVAASQWIPSLLRRIVPPRPTATSPVPLPVTPVRGLSTSRGAGSQRSPSLLYRTA